VHRPRERVMFSYRLGAHTATVVADVALLTVAGTAIRPIGRATARPSLVRATEQDSSR
jgi:hypothetical protein